MTGVGKRRNGWAAAMVAALLAAALLAVPSLRAAEDVVVAKPESVGMSSERLQRIDSFIQEYIDADRIAGRRSPWSPARARWSISRRRAGATRRTVSR